MVFSLCDAMEDSRKSIIPFVGDAGKLLVLVLLVPFFTLLVLHEFDVVDVFSNLYQEEGFCVQAKVSSPWMRGHAISFYACSAMALWMQFLVFCGLRSGMSEESMKPIKKNSISLFGHSLGHAYLGFQTNDETGGARIFEDLSFSGRILTFIVLQFVWYGFMRQRSAKRTSTFAFALALFHNSLQVFILPTRLFFTHVLLAVLASSSFRGLSRDYSEKTIYYALEAWLVDVNILVMTFVESFTCETFLLHIGGHVWFDMVVPFGFTAYFFILFQKHCKLKYGTGMCGVLQNVFLKEIKTQVCETPKVAAVLTSRVKLS